MIYHPENNMESQVLWLKPVILANWTPRWEGSPVKASLGKKVHMTPSYWRKLSLVVAPVIQLQWEA
jgi:hypothetical protein